MSTINCYLCNKDVTNCYFMYSYTYDSKEKKPIPKSLYTSQLCKKDIEAIQKGEKVCNFDGCEPTVKKVVETVAEVKPLNNKRKPGRPAKKKG